jgi:tetratricopeptide (TPR) repeat protein
MILAIMLVVISLFAIKSYEFIAHKGPVCNMTKPMWEQDLAFLVDKYETEYPDIFSQIDSAELMQKINGVRQYIKSGTENQIQMSILDMHASLHDAHSIPLFFDPAYNLHFFPIRIYPFKEGWFVTDAGRDQKNVIGHQLIAINNTPMDTIFDNYQGAFSYESEAGKTERFKMWGLMAEWLYFNNYISELDHALFTFKTTDGNEISKSIPAIRGLNMIYWTYLNKIETNSSLVFENAREDYYWYTYNENAGNLYVHFNKVENQEGRESIAEFSEQLKSVVTGNKINKFILDLRINDGGDDSYLVPLFELIKQSSVNKYGKLFVLIGPHTFSSAALFAWKLQMQTEAIFVGEPTGQGVSFNANPQFVRLPNSKMVFTLSKTSTDRSQPKWIIKPGNSIYPDQEIKLSVHDFMKHTDPLIQYAKSYKPKNLDEHLVDTMLINTITGRYRLSDFHVLNIISQKAGLKMIIDDFVDGSLYQVEKNLIYDKESKVFRDQNNLFRIELIDDQTVQLFYNEQKVVAKKDSSLISAFEAFKYNELERGLELIKTSPSLYIENNTQLENILVNLGYKYLQDGATEKSLPIFKTATEIFPQSWNTFDSYAEALAKNGEIEKSIQNYTKSVQLNPDNIRGKEMIEKLKSSLN